MVWYGTGYHQVGIILIKKWSGIFCFVSSKNTIDSMDILAPGHSYKVSCRNNNYTYVNSCSKRSLLQLLFTRVLKRWVFYLCILYPAPKRPFIHYRVGISTGTYFVPTLHRTSKTLSFIKTSEIQKLITFVKSIHHMWSQSYRYPFQPKKGPNFGHNLVTANIDITKSMLE